MAGRQRSGLKLCLAASGGGHVRQLLDLEPVWRDRDYFFVSENTALGRSLATKHPIHFVDHYALGQARLGRTGQMLRGAFANMFQSWRIIRAERPDVVISTGAGAVFWVALFARLMGARFILIDSFARFDHPSKFARLARPFATRTIVQAPPLKAIWPDAELFDPLRIVDEAPPPKQPLLFATVGATLPFPRLSETVLALKAAGRIPERVIVQVGEAPGPHPEVEGAEIVESIDFGDVQALLKEAAIVICHGGTGSLITALSAGCRVIAMPRRFDLGEHYDNHQEEITAAFAARGLIEVAIDADDVGPALDRIRARQPVIARTDPVALIAHLDALLDQWSGRN